MYVIIDDKKQKYITILDDKNCIKRKTIPSLLPGL